MNYAKLIKQDWPLLSFGFLLTALSSPGQTFFIGLFRDSITAHYNISVGELGLIFSSATLLSAVLFFWTGKLIDRWPLRYAVMVFCSLYALAAALIGLAPHLLIFAVAIFGIRHLGQALMGHISSTTMARYFDHNRAKAISLASMGFSAGEAVFPLTVVALIGLIGWQETWLLMAAIIILAFLPFLQLLLNRTHRDLTLSTDDHSKSAAVKDIYTSEDERHWTRKEVLGDKRFWLMLPALLSSPYLMTGIYFNQASLAVEAGLDLTVIAGFFTIFALAKMSGTLLMGPIVDRYGYLRLYPPCLGLLTLAFFILSSSYGPVSLISFYALSGFAIGAILPVAGSMWPGFYGLKHLGAIRSMAASIMVLATGLAPASYGYMLDAGITISQIATASGIYCMVATLLLTYLMISERKRG